MDRGMDFLKSQVNNAVMQHETFVRNLVDHEGQAEDPRFRDLCSRFIPHMRERRQGSIACMSSVSAQRGGGVFGKVPYSAAKAAILGFTKALARELGATGVTVNAITPGAVDTNIRVGSTEEQEAAINAGIPLGRNATTEEVAAVITFLSSEDSAYLTGTTIDINGGSHIH